MYLCNFKAAWLVSWIDNEQGMTNVKVSPEICLSAPIAQHFISHHALSKSFFPPSFHREQHWNQKSVSCFTEAMDVFWSVGILSHWVSITGRTLVRMWFTMPPRKKEYGIKRASGPLVHFRAPVSATTVRRHSAVVPSVLTFAVIVASGGLLLMIEKGMLNSVQTPPPRASGKKVEYRPRNSDAAVDVESQVR